MLRLFPLAWRQICKEKLRLAVALAGVAFAVILVSMQLGFRSSVFDSATRYHRAMKYELAMLSTKTPFIGFPESFSRRRLFQALAAEEVEAVTAVYMKQGFWRNPWTYNSRSLFVVGFDPSRDIFDLSGVRRNLEILKLPDVALFDAFSRPEFGPVAERMSESADQATVIGEINDRRVTIIDLFELGSSFGIDGSLITSDLNFLRIFPDHPPGFIELGLVRLREGADPEAVRRRLEAALERDVRILTRTGFIDWEVQYWASTTPIGYVFGFGAIMGLIVGGVVVYQILYADVSEHLAEYATLKAVGYTNRHLSALVLQEAAILAGLGYLPGILVSIGLYRVTEQATSLPLTMTAGRALAVLLLTFAMCGVAALIALKKVRSVDPAEIFG